RASSDGFAEVPHLVVRRSDVACQAPAALVDPSRRAFTVHVADRVHVPHLPARDCDLDALAAERMLRPRVVREITAVDVVPVAGQDSAGDPYRAVRSRGDARGGSAAIG